MPNKAIKKVAVAATDIAGLKSSRYEKMQVSYGVVPAGSYSLGDTLVFSDVPSNDIIRATVTAHSTIPVTLEILPGTDVSSALPLSATTTVKISYIIEYIRGTGSVSDAGPGEVLKITVGNS